MPQKNEAYMSPKYLVIHSGIKKQMDEPSPHPPSLDVSSPSIIVSDHCAVVTDLRQDVRSDSQGIADDLRPHWSGICTDFCRPSPSAILELGVGET